LREAANRCRRKNGEVRPTKHWQTPV
jgi:hypothetical protein